MKKLILNLIASGFLLMSLAPSAFAQSNEIKEITVSKRTLPSESIYLNPGQGITLTYAKADQRIETIWLDNSRFVGLSSDGCLTNLEKSCKKNEATSIHLRLIDSQALSSIEKVNQSLLTIVTVDKAGARHHYLYKIYPGTSLYSNNELSLIEYVQFDSTSTQYSTPLLLDRIEKAKTQGLIRNSKLIERVDNFVRLLQQGKTVEQAASEAVISINFINGLLNK